MELSMLFRAIPITTLAVITSLLSACGSYQNNDLNTNKKETEKLSIEISKLIISILPGSRKQEIKRNLPIMLDVIPEFKNYQFVIASTEDMYDLCKQISQGKNVEIFKKVWKMFLNV